jgi:CubicO group peptidase (beta-lactamase class C family)
MWKSLLMLAGVALSFQADAKPRHANKFDALVKTLVRETDFNGNILVAEKGRILFQKSVGTSDPETGKKLDRDSLFLAGSVSKTLTATAVMQLVERGDISLDDNMSKYLPESPYKNITIRHLMSHSSGLAEYQIEGIIEKFIDKNVDNATFWKIYSALNPAQQFAPGDQWSYSNTNYILLALIVERVSGHSFANQLKDSVLSKADMGNTFVLRSSIPESQRTRIAEGLYFPNLVSPALMRITSSPRARSTFATIGSLTGPGNIYMTSNDLLKFHTALQNNILLRAQTQAKMYDVLKLSAETDYKAVANSNYPAKYGLGWFVANDTGNGRIVFHAGGNPGYSAYYLRNLDNDQCVVILTNGDGMVGHFTSSSFMRILNGRDYQLDSRSLVKTVGKTYARSGLKVAMQQLDQLQNTEDYKLSESEMSDLGLQIFYIKKDKAASLAVLNRNVELFPDEWNAWDSLGEVQAAIGNKAEAIRAYERSLQLNPKSEKGREMLVELKR